ncbi:hypothetical protein MTO96_003960 [Rhipicephalus appendiculatus]
MASPQLNGTFAGLITAPQSSLWQLPAMNCLAQQSSTIGTSLGTSSLPASGGQHNGAVFFQLPVSHPPYTEAPYAAVADSSATQQTTSAICASTTNVATACQASGACVAATKIPDSWTAPPLPSSTLPPTPSQSPESRIFATSASSAGKMSFQELFVRSVGALQVPDLAAR